MPILIFLLWLVLNGALTREILIIGVVCTLLVCLFMYIFMGYSPRSDLWALLHLPWMIVYVVCLVFEIIRAALNVMKVSFDPKKKPDPVIIEFHSGFMRDFSNVLLANSITLTPGTITVFQEGDFFVVHCLRKEYGEGIGDSSFVRLLRIIDHRKQQHTR